MAEAETVLSTTGLCVRIRERSVLDQISFTVGAGEIVTLIGPNGAGKTTLLRALLGLQKINAGAIYRKPGLRIGYMPQRLEISNVLPLQVLRFLQLGGHSRDRCIAALQQTGIEHLAGSPVRAVSGGESQRILLARALLCTPDLLALDEPAQGVDVQGQNELYALIGELRNTLGCAVLMVSHDLHLVMAATDIVICLNGHVCCAGKPETVRLNPAYLNLFGPAPEPELALYAHHHDHHHDLHGEVSSTPTGS